MQITSGLSKKMIKNFLKCGLYVVYVRVIWKIIHELNFKCGLSVTIYGKLTKCSQRRLEQFVVSSHLHLGAVLGGLALVVDVARLAVAEDGERDRAVEEDEHDQRHGERRREQQDRVAATNTRNQFYLSFQCSNNASKWFLRKSRIRLFNPKTSIFKENTDLPR